MNPEAQPAVEILLATFNGEPFLRRQIDSIAAQDYPEVRILARDDGSSDATTQILAEYTAAYPDRLCILPAGSSAGSARDNFLALMQAATGPYIAFADQDDIWLPDKLSRSMAAMRRLEARHPSQTPLLVFTDLAVVGDTLEPLYPSLWKHLALDPGSIHDPARVLGRSIVTGSTMLINRPLLYLARQMPPQAVMHDRWIAMLASLMGTAAYLREPTVLYRQHAANVVGAEAPDNSPRGLLRRALSSHGRRLERQRSEQQAEALLAVYRARLSPAAKVILKRYLRSGRSSARLTRLWLTLRHGFYRGSIAANLALLLDLARAPTGPSQRIPRSHPSV